LDGQVCAWAVKQAAANTSEKSSLMGGSSVFMPNPEPTQRL
jgi:hypothetical protein